MIFRPELAAKVLAGEKTVTRRLCSDNPRSPWWREQCAFLIGETYAVQAKRGTRALARIRIVSTSREVLGAVGEDEARREGFAGTDAFFQAWSAINGGDCDPLTWVWRIEFEVVR